ncbi:MAG: hypothetical protein ACLSVD_18765, partial [Eggerthellaceae bacterium]
FRPGLARGGWDLLSWGRDDRASRPPKRGRLTGEGGPMGLTVADIKRRLQEADEREFAVLERALVADVRRGVREAVEVARRRLEADRLERERLARLYAYERELAADEPGWSGLDEVGRGRLRARSPSGPSCCRSIRSSKA